VHEMLSNEISFNTLTQQFAKRMLLLAPKHFFVLARISFTEKQQKSDGKLNQDHLDRHFLGGLD